MEKELPPYYKQDYTPGKKDFLPWLHMIHEIKPKTILEIGTHRCRTACRMLYRAVYYNPNVYYIGYDVFEEGSDTNNKKEFNEKGLGTLRHAEYALRDFKHELYKGLTINTLTTPRIADLVFIDGGHSYETVKHDYNMIKESPHIIFDDYNLSSVKQFVDEINYEIVCLSHPTKKSAKVYIKK